MFYTSTDISCFISSVNLNPASLMLKEASVLGMLIWLAPDKDFAQALAALTAGSAKGGWVSDVTFKFSFAHVRYSNRDKFVQYIYSYIFCRCNQ